MRIFRSPGLFRALIIAVLCGFAGPSFAQDRLVDLVYPYLDTQNSRWFYFASACRPFGMVSLFPDTQPKDDWGGGYRYEIDTVKAFSHIHEWQLSGVSVMPVRFDSTEVASVLANPSSPFSHKLEKVQPGYHVVLLERFKILAQLTASSRVGFHQYVYDLNNNTLNPGVVLDLGGVLGPSRITGGSFQKVSATEIRGHVMNGPNIRRPKECPVFFNLLFNYPIKRIYLLDKGKVTEDVDSWSGVDGKILIEFDKPAGLSLRMKAAVSFTSEEGAANNQKEIADWNFYTTLNEAQSEWEEMLGRIRVRGGDEVQQRRFYTDLYHAIMGRRIISDLDGAYPDNTGSQRTTKSVPKNAEGKPAFGMYNSDAFWGAQWSLNTLWQLVYPEKAEEFCNSFLEYYKNGGLIPRGPSGGDYTFVMTGAPTTPFMVSAWQKGIRGFDANLAYEGLKKNHLPGGLMSKAGYEHHTSQGGGVEHYIEKGYVPYPLSKKQYGYHQDGAGMTLEYAYQDWCMAQFAQALGKNEDAALFTRRSQSWRNLYNPATGFIQPKDSTGAWKDPFDPLEYDHGFIEGNAAQFTWFVPHDLPGLFELMGGKQKAIDRLNDQFEQSRAHRFCNEHPGNTPRFVNDKRTWINYSNQPNMQTAFLFNHAGAPWLTQYWSREVINAVYSGLTPDTGYYGDEDQGLMGALSVLMKMGLFQMSGGAEADPYYEIGSPIFEGITISLDGRYYPSTSLRITANQVSDQNRYIQSAQLNGKPVQSFRIRHSELLSGGRLILEMGSQPNKAWGVKQ